MRTVKQQCIILMAIALVTGCGEQDERGAATNDESVQQHHDDNVRINPNQAQQHSSIKSVTKYLPEVAFDLDNLPLVWTTVSAFDKKLRALGGEHIIEAVNEFLQLRNALGAKQEPNSLAVAAKIENAITIELSRRLNENSLSQAAIESVLLSYSKPVFSKKTLENMIEYKPQANQGALTYGYEAKFLVDYAFEQSGGEDKLFDGVYDENGKVSESWLLLSSNNYLKLSLIINSRRKHAALNAYILYMQRGGDITTRPMFTELKKTVPDLLSQPITIAPGLSDEPISTLEIEDLANTK